jgi:hypothetical protein
MGRCFFVDYFPTLQRTNTKNSKKIFPEKELLGTSPNSNFHIHVYVSVLYLISAYSAAGNMWTDPGKYINCSQTHQCEVGTEAAQTFLENEYVNRIFFAVYIITTMTTSDGIKIQVGRPL